VVASVSVMCRPVGLLQIDVEKNRVDEAHDIPLPL